MRWLVRNVLSSWVAAFLPSLVVCVLTLQYPLVHEWLHSVGFALLGLKSVVVCYPTLRGEVYRCVPLVQVPYEWRLPALGAFSLAVDFPYVTCIGLLVAVCLLYLAGVVFSKRRVWFFATLVTSTLLTVVMVAFWVLPCWSVEWLRLVSSALGVTVL